MSFYSTSSQSSGGHLISLNDFLALEDGRKFAWDDENREDSPAWIAPVDAAGLDWTKHKVFTHGGKEYLQPPSPFVLLSELGESGSTIVYRVLPPEGSGYRRPLALKIIVCKETSRPPGPDSQARMNALIEVKNMSDIRHPHIVAYVASFEDYCVTSQEIKRRPRGKATPVVAFNKVNQRVKKHVLGIAMYPPAQCNLHTFMDEVLQSTDQSNWMLGHLHSYFGCLSQAVAYLHRQGVQIRHKDIKPENIVIDEYGNAILTDFGLSKHFESGHHSEGPTPKTLKYAAPEAMQEQQRDESADIFSLGCVFLEMATVLLGKPAKFAEEQLSAGSAPDYRSISSGSVRGTADFMYSESIYSLDAFITTLRIIGHDIIENDPTPLKERSAKGILAVLPHIRRMMDECIERRPEAHQLYPWFRHLYDIHEHPGPCANCEHERLTGNAILVPSRNNSPALSRSATISIASGSGGGGGESASNPEGSV
ncbi:hypothetical protein VTJ04DRAFT_6584 [Mycothermus thermophilus]|uniref:uncharacterized protein n=1 Tax=Humicola insolens TaxID=85995 RepID=UPI0037423199